MRTLALLGALAFVNVACSGPMPPPSGTSSGATCPPTSTLTYDAFGRSFMAQHCTRCHSSALSGSARMTAPVGVDFDTVEDIREQADRIDAQAAVGPAHENRFMPPTSPFPTDAERTDLGVWLACGAP